MLSVFPFRQLEPFAPPFLAARPWYVGFASDPYATSYADSRARPSPPLWLLMCSPPPLLSESLPHFQHPEHVTFCISFILLHRLVHHFLVSQSISLYSIAAACIAHDFYR